MRSVAIRRRTFVIAKFDPVVFPASAESTISLSANVPPRAVGALNENSDVDTILFMQPEVMVVPEAAVPNVQVAVSPSPDPLGISHKLAVIATLVAFAVMSAQSTYTVPEAAAGAAIAAFSGSGTGIV